MQLKPITTIIVLSLVVASLSVAGCTFNFNAPASSASPTAVPTTAPRTVTQIMSSDANFSTLASYLNKANMTGVLDGGGNFTLFAPDNAAFSKVDAATLTNLENNTTALRTILLNHIMVGISRDFTGSGTFTTLSGRTIPYSSNKLILDNTNATITKADINATNGVIHKIDTVLAPTATPISNTLSAWNNAFSKAGYEIITPFKQNLGVISGTVNDGAAKLKPYKYDISIKEVATRDEAKAAFNAAITKAQQQGYQSGSLNLEPDRTWSGYLGNQGFQSDKIASIHIEEPDTLWTQVWDPFVIVPGSHTMYYVEATYSTTI